MKKYLLSLSLVAGISVVGMAQAVLDAPAAQILAQSRLEQSPASRAGNETYVKVSDTSQQSVYIITFKGEGSAQQLAAAGFEVVDAIGNMALVKLNGEELLKVAGMEGIASIALDYQLKPLLDSARATTGVDAAQAGTELDKAYTGKGVLVGMLDGGFDVHHTAFNDESGKSRISRLWVLTGANSSIQTFATPEEINAYTTDRSDSSHGTHVLGIAAGSKPGKGKQASINPRTGKLMTSSTSQIPYHGVAYDAVLAPCIGTFENNNTSVAAGIISDYADEVGMPVVMNMSLGNNIGPHDGTAAQNRYIAEYGKKMIICISAGNEGGDPVSLHKDFKAGDLSLKTSFRNPSATIVDMWGGDSTPFNVSLIGVDKTTGSVVFTYKFTESSILTGSGYNNPSYVHAPDFDAYFGAGGAIVATINTDPVNNRYNAYFNVMLASGASSANVVPAFLVEGTAGKCVDVYSGDGLTSYSIPGLTGGNAEMSINNLACGDNVICVGAHNNRSQIPCFSGILNTNTVVGDIAYFSSYGKLPNGSTLPHITAPGQGIISSYSNYYVDATNSAKSATAEIPGTSPTGAARTSYWGEMSGTSMSSPFVAGVCALWLQADPTLTVDEVKAIMKETADQDEFTKAAPHRFGYGKINALAGLKRILGLGSVTGVKTDSEILVNTLADGTFDIFAPGASTLKAELFGLSGALAASTSASGESLTLAKDAAAPGVYVLRVTTDSGATATRKVIVK
ncbi:MAG: S8 family serine peptidase [Bacteroidales bacterium]|nr:S8 family serine peptidase [Bacteroidales bacterium]